MIPTLKDVLDLTPAPFRIADLVARDVVEDLERRIAGHEAAAARQRAVWLDASDDLFCASQLRALRSRMLGGLDRTPPCGVQILPERSELEAPRHPRLPSISGEAFDLAIGAI